MKRIVVLILCVCLLWGCGAKETAPTQTLQTEPANPVESVPVETEPLTFCAYRELEFVSRFETVTQITLSDTGISVNGGGQTETVYLSEDIVYYEDTDSYESGNPYGDGEAWERHTKAEAESHTVVNITAPGAYRLTGKLSAGQIRVDLGEAAYGDENAVVELILSDADITCKVAPAILFQNVYECDGNWSAETAGADINTEKAGANLILEGENAVTGSHVAKIYKDKEGQKKLWKQDGAIYSYMSMNVFGPGKLDLTADNEGLDSELHLTINGGDIAIRADNDGINTNEDGVSVTTINGGNLHIMAGLGAEGDGIDSNGWLVINGGTVVSAANPVADAGLDSDMGSFIHGGNVIALGSSMDWAESDSEQVTMNLQFAQNQSSDAAVVVTRLDGTVIFAYDPGADETLAENKRIYSGAVISCPNFHLGETYHVYVGGVLTGTDYSGVYDPVLVTDYTGGTRMAYTGTDVMRGPGGMGFGGMDFGADMPEGFDPQNPPQDMEGFDFSKIPEGMENRQPSQGGNVENRQPPQGGNFDPADIPEDWKDFNPDQRPEDGKDFAPGNPPEGMEQLDPSMFGQTTAGGEPDGEFYMQDQVNFFSGLTQA